MAPLAGVGLIAAAGAAVLSVVVNDHVATVFCRPAALMGRTCQLYTVPVVSSGGPQDVVVVVPDHALKPAATLFGPGGVSTTLGPLRQMKTS